MSPKWAALKGHHAAVTFSVKPPERTASHAHLRRARVHSVIHFFSCHPTLPPPPSCSRRAFVDAHSLHTHHFPHPMSHLPSQRAYRVYIASA